MSAYKDTSCSIDERVESLLEQMTLQEKVNELGADVPINERLGIPQMNHGEILHGVMWRSSHVAQHPEKYEGALPTIFPQPIAMGCTFDPELIERTGQAVAREARALDRHHCYLQHTNDPLYPFGHGLSYTAFAYSEIRLSKDRIGPAESITVGVTVTNTGERAGDEVVQCYVSDEIGSVTPLVKQLRGFKRIHLNPGISCDVTFELPPDALAIWNANMEKIVEPGWFTVTVGGSSEGGVSARFVVAVRGQEIVAPSDLSNITISREQDMEAPE